MNHKPLIEVLGVALLLGLSITFMTIFNNAVLNGGSTVVDINSHGEMIVELLLLNLVVWPAISVGLYHWIKTHDNSNNHTEEAS